MSCPAPWFDADGQAEQLCTDIEIAARSQSVIDMEAHAPIFQNKMHDTPLRAKTVVCYSEDRLTLQCGQHGFRALLCRTANKSNMALFGAFGIFQMPNQIRSEEHTSEIQSLNIIT